MVRATAVAATVASLSTLSGVAAFEHLSAASALQQLDPNRILCPVLASMYNAGDLRPDEYGSLELEEIKAGLMNGIGVQATFADFQAAGIADYDLENKETEVHRDRCIPGFTLSGTACSAKRALGYHTDDMKRWLNIFQMNGKQTVEHGFSTGVRGGATNVPELSDSCNGTYPCEDRFQKFYVQHANDKGRFYLENILEIICHAKAEGDRGGEFAYNNDGVPFYVPGLDISAPAREWQMKAAMQGWLAGFGRTDEVGDLYFTLEDVRAMLMEGRYPDGYQKRSWGCMTSGCSAPVVDMIMLELPCQDVEWWQGTSCEIATGETCRVWCNGGADCISGKCFCGRGSNGLGMCANDGVCVERTSTCTYFGEPCVRIPADNPGAASSVTTIV